MSLAHYSFGPPSKLARQHHHGSFSRSVIIMSETDRIYLREAERREFTATCFYPTGGGQPHDTGMFAWGGENAAVTAVSGKGPIVFHTLEGTLPAVGTEVTGTVDWDRRHQLMRPHTVLHILCGVIWNEWKTLVTGGNMEPLSARMDFEFDPLPEGFAARVTDLVNAEIAADRPIEISFLPRHTALTDDDLIRTKVRAIRALVQHRLSEPRSKPAVRVTRRDSDSAPPRRSSHRHSRRESRPHLCPCRSRLPPLRPSLRRCRARPRTRTRSCG
jgi:Ser-tRNA(Ala) deacylase AlaX